MYLPKVSLELIVLSYELLRPGKMEIDYYRSLLYVDWSLLRVWIDIFGLHLLALIRTVCNIITIALYGCNIWTVESGGILGTGTLNKEASTQLPDMCQWTDNGVS